MERTMSTDDRLDDLALAMREGLERVDRDLSELRTDVRELRTLVFQLWAVNTLAIVGAIVTTLITGA
jgi:hypothetical protein